MNNSGKIVQLVNPTAAQDAATKSYVDTSIPIGGIIMWSGTNNTWPSNWRICDGSNGTPDLRGRFVLSSGQGSGLTNRTTGGTGGSETVALTEAQMPKHSHGVSASTSGNDGGHTHGHSWSAGIPASVYGGGNRSWNSGGGHTDGTALTIDSTSSTHSHTITVTESKKGGNATLDVVAHENMPPFYVLAFIMRIS